MKAKIICMILALAIAAVGFSACGKTETTADTTAPVIGAQEDGQNPVMNFIGNYQADRRTMLVEAQGMEEAKVTVSWGIDAWTSAVWVMTGKVVEEGGDLVMRYTDGAYATVTTDENGNETRADETNGGTGTIWFKNDNTVVWTDDQDELVKDIVFEWIPVVADDASAAETDALFQKGVWSASIDGKIDTYFVFYDEANGHTERADGTGGVPFTCEQSGWNIVFHFGSADDVTNAVFSEGDNTGTFDYGDKTVTYTFEAVADADADTFEVPAAGTDAIFKKGVWSAAIDGKIDTYFVFYDEANGRTERADGTGGAPFTCEQSGWNIVFHFGSADDVTNAKFSEGENTGTFDYGDKTVTYTFEAVADADADTFEVPAE